MPKSMNMKRIENEMDMGGYKEFGVDILSPNNAATLRFSISQFHRQIHIICVSFGFATDRNIIIMDQKAENNNSSSVKKIMTASSSSSCDVEALKKCLEENKGDYVKCHSHIEAFKSSCSIKS
ncbi:hypothetical protein RIF29_23658 [Crotalaria pallida]|uniref:Uncharacterized protein n=1 Tax=Crotalaria pallida TaxID=3830 RepID=A0AAN9F5X9_CROPI